MPDVRRAVGELGVSVRVPLDDALARTAAWYARTHRTACDATPA